MKRHRARGEPTREMLGDTLRRVPIGAVPPPTLLVSLGAAGAIIALGAASWLPAVDPRGRAVMIIASSFVEVVGLIGWAKDLGRWCEQLKWSPALDFRRAQTLLTASLVCILGASAVAVAAGLSLGTAGEDDFGLGGTGAEFEGPVTLLAVLAIPSSVLFLLGLLKLRRAQKGLRIGLAKGAAYHPSLETVAG